ncbi:MAG: PqqD family protein [candidate division WOR-3 bacterium]
MKNSVPIFRRENLSYWREEREGYVTLISKVHPETRELIINLTAKEILDLCNGIRAIEEIEDEIQNKYPLVKKEQIKIDVAKTLSSFSRLGIIEWINGDNPFLYRRKEPLSDNFWMGIGQEEEIHKIGQLIKSIPKLESYQNNGRYFIYKSPYFHYSEYEELPLRQKLFAYLEDFSLLYHKEEIVGMISIEIPLLRNTTAGIIKLIIVPRDLFEELIKYAQDNFPRLAVKDITKIKILELSTEPLDIKILEILHKIGYKEEGVLQDEFGFGRTVKILSRCYDLTFIERINKTRMKGGE